MLLFPPLINNNDLCIQSHHPEGINNGREGVCMLISEGKQWDCCKASVIQSKKSEGGQNVMG